MIHLRIIILDSSVPYLAVEDDGGGGGGALEDADDLVEAALVRRRVLVQRDPKRLHLFVLRSDGHVRYSRT